MHTHTHTHTPSLFLFLLLQCRSSPVCVRACVPFSVCGVCLYLAACPPHSSEYGESSEGKVCQPHWTMN